jgi:hypothetical protein
LINEHASRCLLDQQRYVTEAFLPTEQTTLAQLNQRLSRLEHEHQQLKRLVLELKADRIAAQPTYRTTLRVSNFETEH